MLRKVLLALFILFVFSTVCLAEEKKEWKDPSFNFKSLKMVLVQSVISTTTDIKQEDKQKIDELVTAKILKAENLKLSLITPDQLEELVSKASGSNIRELKDNDNERYKAIMVEYTPKIIDAVVKVDVYKLESKQIFVPETTQTFTTYRTEYVTEQHIDYNNRYGAGGNYSYTTTRAVQVPVEQTITVSAHYDTASSAAAELTLTTANNQKKIWSLFDSRDAMNKAPLAMTENIFKRSMDKFRNLTK